MLPTDNAPFPSGPAGFPPEEHMLDVEERLAEGAKARPAFALTWPVRPFYSTPHGLAILGDSRKALKSIPDETVNLIVTSPPYALQKPKEYGNEPAAEYVKWFRGFINEFKRVLTPDGSLVINIGGSWNPGQPTRSLYHYQLLIELVNEDGLHLAQDFYWFNPAKMPNPIQWVNIDRTRVKDAVEHVWWLSKTPRPKANNRNVLATYTKSMENLFRNGYNAGKRPSGWNVKAGTWSRDNGGAIPPNFFSDLPHEPTNTLAFSNTDSNSQYLAQCRAHGISPHPARFPRRLPEFFIQFLTEPGDLVLDPFAGSNLTGEVAEASGRKWVAVDTNQEYLIASTFRFSSFLESPTIKATHSDVGSRE